MAPKTSQKASALKVTVEEVLAAIESLYADQLRPQGRILLKRLGERAAAALAQHPAVLRSVPVHGVGAEVVPRIDTAHLRRVCERSPLLEVGSEAGTEYTALLVGRLPAFVDPSAEDRFPECLWAEMAAFFSGGQSRGMRLPGGRYACARALAHAGLPFLLGRSLGEVCHIVQLAVSDRQILGYLDGQVVPYCESEAVVKQQSAMMQQPAWALKKDGLPVADLGQARECLRAILAATGGNVEGVVPLPNVKRLFRSQFQLELSETALGHCRVSDLLQDERFHDICTLRQQGKSYVVVRQEAASVPEAPADEAGDIGERDCMRQCVEESPAMWASYAVRTFLHFKSNPGTPVRRSSSVPRDHGSSKWWRASRSVSSGASTSTSSDIASTEASDDEEPMPTAPLQRFCPEDPLCLEEGCDVAVLGSPLVTPSPPYDAPYDFYALLPPRAPWCPEEPLSLDVDAAPQDFGTSLAFVAVTPSPQYEAPRRSAAWCRSPGAGAVATRAPTAAAVHQCTAATVLPLALFAAVGMDELGGIDAIVEGSESDSESESERVPMGAEPLGFEEAQDVVTRPEGLQGCPLMTPSPQTMCVPATLAASHRAPLARRWLGGVASVSFEAPLGGVIPPPPQHSPCLPLLSTVPCA